MKKGIVKKTKEVPILIIITISIVLLDQVIKLLLQNVGQINIIPNVLNFNISKNQNESANYIITNIIILIILIRFIMLQNTFVNTKLRIFLSFIIAGGISNLIDRILKGYVIEYIDFKQVINIPIFNIADVFVIIGWICVIAIFTNFTAKEWKKSKIEKNLKENKKEE